MLIESPRHTKRDLEVWARLEEADRVLSRLRKMESLEQRAQSALRSFASAGPTFYIGMSWGKDSVTVAHLAWRIGLRCPLIWFPAGKIENPDCVLVRDNFLSRWPSEYREIDAAPTGPVDDVFGHDGAQAEFERAAKSLNMRYASGVRAAESAARRWRMRNWGESSPHTCAPIGWWPTEFVFAYLAKYDLPVHPIYACSMGGTFPREHIRVGTVGGYRGTGHGRRELERHYYPEVFRATGMT